MKKELTFRALDCLLVRLMRNEIGFQEYCERYLIIYTRERRRFWKLWKGVNLRH